jgi:hypothetical protein
MIDPASLPPSVLQKIAVVEQRCIGLTAQWEQAQRDLRDVCTERSRLAYRTVNDEYEANREVERYEAERQRLDKAIVAQEQAVERTQRALKSTEAVIRSCKAWLNELPSNARLVEVTGRVQDLDVVRERIARTRAEIDALERMPTPSSDLSKRIRAHVQRLAEKAQPLVTGIGDGETLKAMFPLNDHADRRTQTYFSQDDANPLLLAALLHPERLTDRLLAAAMASGIPKGERDAKLKTLRSQLEQARYDEEASLGNDVRSSSQPAWAVLMVKQVTAKRAAA